MKTLGNMKKIEGTREKKKKTPGSYKVKEKSLLIERGNLMKKSRKNIGNTYKKQTIRLQLVDTFL